MKRLAMAVFAALLVFGAAGESRAVDVKVEGTWEIGMGWTGNPGFYDALKKIDPVMASRFHPHHTARLVRAISRGAPNPRPPSRA